MTEPILDTGYWERRLKFATQRHYAVFKTPLKNWLAIEAKHQEILKRHILPGDSILDAGCGWGRLLNLMPEEWKGPYHGVDLSPDFIELAKEEWPDRNFSCEDLRDLMPEIKTPIFDYAILISIRPMVIRNLDQESWDLMEKNLRRVADVLLYLEYDVNDEGSLE